jgi:hypothetical protein
MNFPFIFVHSGLIVALIMNTAAAGATVWLRFSPKCHLSDFVSSARNFLEHTLKELGRPHCWHRRP